MSKFFKISEAGSLGFHALAIMAREPDHIHPVKEMADRLGKSQAHLAKVIQALAKAGLLDNSRGPNGGCRIKPQTLSVNLFRIYEILEGDIDLNPCLFEDGRCEGICIFGELTKNVSDIIHQYFKSHTVQDMAMALKDRTCPF
jgi:Rrf2 family protein